MDFRQQFNLLSMNSLPLRTFNCFNVYVWIFVIGSFNRAYSIIRNKNDLYTENARIKQVLKENGYQKSIISKIFKRFTNNHSLSQSQQQWKATDIQGKETRMSINLQVKNFSVYSNLTELYTLSTLKAICINSFVNLKIEWLQKIKKILYTKLTVVTAKQSTWWI